MTFDRKEIETWDMDDLLLDRTLRRFRDHAIKRRRGCRHCLTIAIALRSVVGSAIFVCDYLMILISYTENNYGIGYIER